MSYTKKPFEELDVIDDFLMNAVATDPEVGEAFCRKILSTLLQREIGKIRIVTQRSIPADTPEHRGIRMDVEVEEAELLSEKMSTLNIYDIEPHTRKDMVMPKRNRFYQAKIDGKYLQRGEKDFNKLPNLYVITITNYDVFGADYMMYTIHNQCEEVPEMVYEDGLCFIYFNTKGTKGGNEAIRNLLNYFQNSQEGSITDDTTREVHEYVSRVRVQPEVRMEYMRFDEIIAYEREDAVVETKRADILELLEEYGEVTGALRERIENENSTEVLKRWHKLAAKTDTIEAFAQNM